VSATPNPRLLVSDATVVALKPGDGSVLFTRVSPSFQIYEKLVDSVTAEQLVGAGSSAVFDSAGDTVILTQNGPVLAASYRGSFGSAAPLGTGQPARFSALSGASRGVAILGEGTTTSARPALLNARAPDRPIYLATYNSPVQLSSPVAYVVTY
jgi:hypothetical protein